MTHAPGHTLPADEGPQGGSAAGPPASAPYNMALAGHPQKKINGRYGHSRHNWSTTPPHPLISVVIDKLRLWALTDARPDDAEGRVFGLESGRVVEGRRRGSWRTRMFKGWSEPPGVEGGFYVQVSDVGTHSRELVVEFNPAKMSVGQFRCLQLTLAGFGVQDVGGMVVERYDVAFDYSCHRSLLMLDDRVRLLDMFGVSRKGPETERTGFRRGSRLKVQLYDKTAERRSKGDDARAGVTRFEVQVQKPRFIVPPAPLFTGKAVAGRRPVPVSGASHVRGGVRLLPPTDDDDGQALRLRDLPHVPWPAPRVQVRLCPFHPVRLAKDASASLVALARGMGIAYAMGFVRDHFGVSGTKVGELVDQLLPVVDEPPAKVWRSRLGPAVAEAVAPLGDLASCARALAVQRS